MAESTCIFEIPLLMDLICENLYKADIAACRLQDWELSDDSKLDPEHRQTLVDHADCARDLVVSMTEKGSIGPFLQELAMRNNTRFGLYRLSSLDCLSGQESRIPQDNSATARTVYYLIQQNFGLRKLSLADVSLHMLKNLGPVVDNVGLLSVLADHSFLRSLVLSSSRSMSDEQARAMLQHIPVKLQVLEANWEISSHDKKNKFPDIGWKTNSSLRRLRLRGSFKNYE
ncbi:hypothetical protein CPC16_007161 [Podila verticillata]|nr:hypothetical protein CPC16_007161 [Podila verticillata]